MYKDNKNNTAKITMFADLPDHTYSNTCTIPETFINDPSLFPLKPDMCIIKSNHNNTYDTLIMELTVPFEHNIISSHKYKMDKYRCLINHINNLPNIN